MKLPISSLLDLDLLIIWQPSSKTLNDPFGLLCEANRLLIKKFSIFYVLVIPLPMMIGPPSLNILTFGLNTFCLPILKSGALIMMGGMMMFFFSLSFLMAIAVCSI